MSFFDSATAHNSRPLDIELNNSMTIQDNQESTATNLECNFFFFCKLVSYNF
jgi:hypothetical protein